MRYFRIKFHKMKKITLLCLFMALFIIAFGQGITVTVPNIAATPGQTVYVPVKVWGASSSGTPLTTIGIQLTFDNTKVTYITHTNFFSLMPQSQWFFSGNYSTYCNSYAAAANWAEPSYTGATVAVPDGTTIYEIQFTYLQGTCPLNFCVAEFTDANYNIIPTVTVNGSIGPPLPTTYTWTGATSTNWTVSTNWNPVRTTPATTDILQFNSGGFITVTNVPTENISQLFLANNTSVTLQSSAEATLTIQGYTGTDLTVPSGSSLILGGSVAGNAILVQLSTGATAVIGGNMTFTNSGGPTIHRFTATDANGITFQSGSLFTTQTNCSGSPFGITALNSVIFQSGASFIHGSGDNPFGATAPNAVAVFQTGSLYKVVSSVVIPSFSGRTYSHVEIDHPAYSNTATGTSYLIFDNFTMTNGIQSLDLTGGISIKGNLSAATGSTLRFNGSSGNVTFNGTTAQSINGSGSIIMNPGGNVVVSNTAGVTNNTALTVRNLNITAGFIRISPLRNLTVTGVLTNSAGNAGIQVKCDATGTGSLIMNTSGVAGTVERFISHWTNNEHGWHFLSSPVVAQPIQPGFVPNPPGSAQDFYSWDETQGIWINTKDASVNWIFPESNFLVGKGYLVAYQNDVTKQFTGNLNVTDVAFNNLTRTDPTMYSGWNLLGNPFSSALTWFTGWTITGVNGIAKIWNESGASYIDIAAGAIIPAMQGFMVQVNYGMAPGQVIIPASARQHSTQAWYKSTNDPLIKLVVYDLEKQTFQESLLAFNTLATSGFDLDSDSYFLPGYAPQFYSVSGELHLSTNTLPVCDQTTVVPFSFIKSTGNSYQIKAETIENISQNVYLTDLKTGQVQNLIQDPEYTFTSESNDNPSRFHLSFGPVGINEKEPEGNMIYYYDGKIHILYAGLRRVQVFTITGQLLLDENMHSTGWYSSKFSFQSGYYIVRLSTESEIRDIKIFIN